MTKVFIGGSRRVTKLNEDIRERLDRIIDKGLFVLVGDANGADKAVQKYLQERDYTNVEVFCMEHECRNNLGNWPLRFVHGVAARKDFNYYATKDRLMAEEATLGFMIWDGKSIGTLANVMRLVKKGKKVVLYTIPSKQFLNLESKADGEYLLLRCPDKLSALLKKDEEFKPEKFRRATNKTLFP